MPGGGKADEIVARILKKPPAERLKLLRESSNPQAQFLWAILRDSFHYAAVHLGDIAETARDVDFAMRWGFGMSQGPFELWQQAGWQQVAEWVKADIDAGKALSKAPLPDWVFDGPVAGSVACTSPRARGARRSALRARRSTLPVYERQHFRETCSAPARCRRCKSGTEVFKQRRGARLDARRRGADRQHHRQAAPDQPDRHRRPAEGGRTGRSRATRAW